MPQQTRSKIKRGLIVQKLENKTVIFDGEKSTLHTLNETATIVFKKYKLGWSAGEIASYLAKNFKVTQQKALKDVEKTLREFKQKNVIVP